MPADTFRSQMRFVLAGQWMEFHLDFETTEPIDIAYLHAFGGRLIVWAEQSLMEHLNQNIALTEVFLKSLDPAQPAEITNTNALPMYGGDASTNSVTTQTAVIVTFYTAELSAQGRGRIFIPGVSNTNLSNSLWNSGAMLGISAAIQDIFDELLDGSPETLVVYSPTGASVRAVQAFAVRNVPGGLNRRRIGRGS